MIHFDKAVISEEIEHKCSSDNFILVLLSLWKDVVEFKRTDLVKYNLQQDDKYMYVYKYKIHRYIYFSMFLDFFGRILCLIKK